MTPEQQDLLEKAKRKLASGKLSFQGGYPEDAVSRAYYSIFYVAKALLLEEKLQLGTSNSYVPKNFSIWLKSGLCNLPKKSLPS